MTTSGTSPSVAQLIEGATNALQQGKLAEADTVLRYLLSQHPDNAEGWHLYGLAQYQAKNHAAAIEAMRRAIALNGNVAEYHNNLAECLLASGRPADAIASYGRAIELRPDFLEACMSRANTLMSLGRLAEAAEAYRGAIRVNPQHSLAYDNLGKALGFQGDLLGAEDAFRNAVEILPTEAEYWFDWGLAKQQLGRADEAIACYRRAIAIRPTFAAAYNNLGNTLREAGRSAEAVEVLNKAVELKPDFADALNNLGIALATLNRQKEAVAALESATRAQPNHANAYYNLGKALEQLDRFEEAAEAYRRAAQINPKYADALNGMATALHALGRLDAAMDGYRAAAAAAQPDLASAASNLLFALHFRPATDAQTIRREHQKWSDRLVAPLRSRREPHRNNRDPDRRLKIGYVSPDLRDHSIAYFFEPILANHDRDRFEVFCYSDVAKPDDVTRRLRSCADHWIDTSAMSNDELAQRVRADGIDLLVDLAVHTAGNRLLAFALKPAPVQLSYLGYCGTSGLDAIDHRITDDVVDPPGETEPFSTETLLRLPRTFCCYRPPTNAPQVAPPPPSEKNGYVTFGSLNTLAKTTPQMIATWAKVLNAVPKSRLLMRARPLAIESVRRSVAQAFASHGVSADRLELLPSAPMTEYLRTFNRIDVLLDTFPFNGHTTTCHALWMGVPVISLTGKIPVSRVGASLLRHVALSDLAVAGVDEYFSAAVSLAEDRSRLAAIRLSLRQRIDASPLRDEKAFVRDLENSYCHEWQKWCAR